MSKQKMTFRSRERKKIKLRTYYYDYEDKLCRTLWFDWNPEMEEEVVIYKRCGEDKLRYASIKWFNGRRYDGKPRFRIVKRR